MNFNVKKSSKICNFFQKVFTYFSRKSEFKPEKTNNRDQRGVTFYPETENDCGLFSLTARFDRLPNFVKYGNTVRNGGKFSIFQKFWVNTPCDISNSLFLITEQK